MRLGMQAPAAPEFDYEFQVWTLDGIIQRCGHPEAMRCGCLGRRYAGLAIAHLYHKRNSERTPLGALETDKGDIVTVFSNPDGTLSR